VPWIEDVLDRAIAQRASDIHFEPQDDGIQVRYRLDGLLQDVETLPKALAENIVARLKVLAGLLTYRIDIPQEGSFTRQVGRHHHPPAQAGQNPAGPETSLDIRVASFPTVRGERVVIRLMHPTGQADTLEGLGLSDECVAALRRAAAQPHGLILATGPAGSGKSTTLYALARHILAATPGRSVVSLEDPVEQRVAGMAQIQVTPHGELDYLRAMRSLLRQDVEVLLVGEIRDAETARVVIEAALTGHLIMSTLHSSDPAEAVARLGEMGIAPYQLVAALTTVCAQRLLRTVCTACAGHGCPACAATGYRGRTACGQVVTMTEPLRAAVLAHTPVSALRELIARTSPTLAMDARRLIDGGKTTRDEVRRVLGTLSER
jgi:general secretion pathway protein E